MIEANIVNVERIAAPNTETAAVVPNMSDHGDGDDQPRVTPATQRRDVYTRLIRQQVEAGTDDRIAALNRVQLKQEIDKLQHNWNRFEVEHMGVVGEQVPAEIGLNDDVLAGTDRIFSALMGKLREKEGAFIDAEKAAQQQNVHVTITSPDMLGNVNKVWGKFSGDYKKWANFKELFLTGVHNNKAIVPVNKFNFLQEALVGEAQRVVGQWQITPENYQKAWKRLCETYDDDYLAAQTIFDQLLETDKLEEQTHSGLRALVDAVHECINQLDTYTSVEAGEGILVLLIASKLDYETYKAWQLHRQNAQKMEAQAALTAQAAQPPEMAESAGAVGGVPAKPSVIPKLSMLTDYLESVLRVLVHAQGRKAEDMDIDRSDSRSRESSSSRGARGGRNVDSRGGRNPETRNERMPEAHTSRQDQGRPGRYEGNSAGRNFRFANERPRQAQQGVYPPCILCKRDHALYHCPMFTRAPLEDRRKIRDENGLCEICLKSHGRGECKKERKDCGECNKQGTAHNSWLCETREAKYRTSLLSVIGNKPEPLSMGPPPRHSARWPLKRENGNGGRDD